MLKSHTRQTYTIDNTIMKRANKKMEKKRINKEDTKQKCRLGTAGDEIIGGLQPSPFVAPWFLRHLVVRFA